MDALDELLLRQRELLESMRGAPAEAVCNHAESELGSSTSESGAAALEKITQPPPSLPEQAGESIELNELFREHYSRFREQESLKEAQSKKAALHVRDLIFYIALIIIFVAGMAFVLSENFKYTGILGFSFYGVRTGSMQSEIPQGSLVAVRKTAPDKISIDDDITFLTADGQNITHRVVGIIENYKGGRRGFETKGVENLLPDEDIADADSVIGRVVFHIPVIGGATAFLSERWFIVFLAAAGLTASVLLLRYAFKKKGGENQPEDGKLSRFKQNATF